MALRCRLPAAGCRAARRSRASESPAASRAARPACAARSAPPQTGVAAVRGAGVRLAAAGAGRRCNAFVSSDSDTGDDGQEAPYGALPGPAAGSDAARPGGAVASDPAALRARLGRNAGPPGLTPPSRASVMYSSDVSELEDEISRIAAENEALKATLASASAERAVRARCGACCAAWLGAAARGAAIRRPLRAPCGARPRRAPP